MKVAIKSSNNPILGVTKKEGILRKCEVRSTQKATKLPEEIDKNGKRMFAWMKV